ncbi:MAG: hypothetical protein IJU70_11895 [Lentisphaeria bacterium]|nr:hypothetical protein [Lentisphaeria bacterium]
MTAQDLLQIGREMSAARMKTPLRNRMKFDIESKDFFAAISDAVRAGDHDRAADLLCRWHERAAWLMNEPRCFTAPPCLVRKEGEPVRDYLNRCFEKERE